MEEHASRVPVPRQRCLYLEIVRVQFIPQRACYTLCIRRGQPSPPILPPHLTRLAFLSPSPFCTRRFRPLCVSFIFFKRGSWVFTTLCTRRRQVRYMRFFRYFFTNNVFVIALLMLALLSAMYLVRNKLLISAAASLHHAMALPRRRCSSVHTHAPRL